jgi:putative ABC transport system permease protein
VGIVRTVRHNAVVEEPRAEMYVSHAQLPEHIRSAPRGMTLTIKTEGDPLALAAAVRDAVHAVDANLPVSGLRTMEAVTAQALSQPRFVTWLLLAFATAAMVLAAVGLYGTISLLVAERTREMGIRLALGARRGAVLRLVLGEGVRLTAVGVTLGLAGAAALARTLGSLVYGISVLDPVTFLLAPVVLAGVALLACLIPAVRAATIAPAVTLK